MILRFSNKINSDQMFYFFRLISLSRSNFLRFYVDFLRFYVDFFDEMAVFEKIHIKIK